MTVSPAVSGEVKEGVGVGEKTAASLFSCPSRARMTQVLQGLECNKL